jgi:hypothetical protein
MTKVDSDPVKTRWFIDIDWFTANNRSLSVLLKSLLCVKCLAAIEKPLDESAIKDIIDAIQACYSHNPDYISDRLPVLEMVFRLIVMRGNQPTELIIIAEQISKLHGGSQHMWVELLSQLLANDQFYGFQSI